MELRLHRTRALTDTEEKEARDAADHDPRLAAPKVALARQMYAETSEDGKRAYTVARIAAEFGVSRPTIYRYLAKQP